MPLILGQVRRTRNYIYDPNVLAWVAQTPGAGKTLKRVSGTTSASATLVSAVASRLIKVTRWSITTTSTTAFTATVQNGSGGTTLWNSPMQAITGTVFGIVEPPATTPDFQFATTAGVALYLTLSSGQPVSYNLTYFDDDTA